MTSKKKQTNQNQQGPMCIRIHEFNDKAAKVSLYCGKFIKEGGKIELAEIMNFISTALQNQIPLLEKDKILHALDARAKIAKAVSDLIEVIVDTEYELNKEK